MGDDGRNEPELIILEKSVGKTMKGIKLWKVQTNNSQIIFVNFS